MQFTSTSAKHPSIASALDVCIAEVRATFGDTAPDLLVVFAAHHFGSDLSMVAGIVERAFPGAVIFGGATSGVIGGGEELEDTVAVAMTAASLPDVEVTPVYVEPEQTLSPELVGVDPNLAPAFLLMSTPGVEVEAMLQSADDLFPHSTVAGGISGSGGRSSQLFLGNRMYSEGTVGVVLAGDLEMSTVVAQGCRPLGSVFVATKTKNNLVFELDGAPVSAVLERWFTGLSSEDQRLFQAWPMVGFAVDDAQLGTGDFLMRNILALDRVSGALAVGAVIEDGQHLQFYVRDPGAARGELRLLLTQDLERSSGRAPLGALLFSCVGRGRAFFGSRGHDSELFGEVFPQVSLAGCFCNGEIGPVRGQSQLHSYSSAFAVFRQKGWD
jgi:small ligand-binding sensory domain FIST